MFDFGRNRCLKWLPRKISKRSLNIVATDKFCINTFEKVTNRILLGCSELENGNIFFTSADLHSDPMAVG